jgi:hypothetical protein
LTQKKVCTWFLENSVYLPKQNIGKFGIKIGGNLLTTQWFILHLDLIFVRNLA